jgi:hypothetical protein
MSVRQYIKEFQFPATRWIWWLRIIWFLILLIFVLFLAISGTGVGNKLEMPTPVKIYSPSNYVNWDRQKAIEFGMDQTATIIKFLFVASAALLGYLSKTLLEPLLAKDGSINIPPAAMVLLRHSAIGCCFSIFYGFVGFTFFMYLPIVDDFSPFAELGVASNCQQLSFLISAILMLAAISYMWRLPRETKQTIHPGE